MSRTVCATNPSSIPTLSPNTKPHPHPKPHPHTHLKPEWARRKRHVSHGAFNGAKPHPSPLTLAQPYRRCVERRLAHPLSLDAISSLDLLSTCERGGICKRLANVDQTELDEGAGDEAWHGEETKRWAHNRRRRCARWGGRNPRRRRARGNRRPSSTPRATLSNHPGVGESRALFTCDTAEGRHSIRMADSARGG